MSSADDSKNPPPAPEAATSAAPSSTDSKPATASQKTDGDDKPATTTTAPLAPPPKPSQTQQQQQAPSQPGQTPDYFGGGHGNGHFSLEPNPFEQSFGNPSSTETPNKAGGLPSVASLTSPAPLGPGGTPNWQNSLRSGPLSPAMLQGPVNANSGYFDQEFRNNYPTPNESSLRTGLTPGGGGSMFPAPSPSTAAIFNLGNGGVTPGTAEFQRAAQAARQKSDNATSNQNGAANGQTMPKQEYQPAQQQGRSDPFAANQQEHEAVNSLYMLAQPNNRNGTNANQFAVSNQPQMGSNMSNINMQQRMQGQSEQSPTTQRPNGSIDMGNGHDDQDDVEDEKPSTRSKGKKGSATKGAQAANGRRKAEENTPSKAPPKKRSRTNTGVSMGDSEDDEMDDEMDMDMMTNSNGKKMTDEEKRRNFLERNRVAALKCRQRKKQWLANLQTKVEVFTQENDVLTQQCSQLREEIINLKTLLLAHKDCPVSHQQGLGGQAMAQFMGNIDPSAGQPPYSMMNSNNLQHLQHIQNQGQGMQQGMQHSQGVQRR